MSDAEFLIFVRSLINEPAAKFWTTEDIAAYKTVGITVAASSIFNLLAVTHKKFTLRDMTINDPYIASPTDFWKVIRVEFASSGQKLPYIQDDELWKFDRVATGTPQVWMLTDGKITQVPTPNVTSTGYWRLFYLPRFTALASLPEELHPLIAIETVISARVKDENVTKDLLLKRDHYFKAAIASLSIAQLQDAEKIGNFDQSEGSSDEWEY